MLNLKFKTNFSNGLWTFSALFPGRGGAQCSAARKPSREILSQLFSIWTHFDDMKSFCVVKHFIIPTIRNWFRSRQTEFTALASAAGRGGASGMAGRKWKMQIARVINHLHANTGKRRIDSAADKFIWGQRSARSDHLFQ